MSSPIALPVKRKDLYRPLSSRAIIPAPHPLIAALASSPTAQLDILLTHRPSWFPLLHSIRQRDPTAYTTRITEAVTWFSEWQILEHRMSRDDPEPDDGTTSLEATWRDLRGRIWMWFHAIAPDREWLADGWLPKTYGAYLGEWQRTWVLRDVREALDMSVGLDESGAEVPAMHGFYRDRFLEALEEDWELYRERLAGPDLVGNETAREVLTRVWDRWKSMDERAEVDPRYGTGLHGLFIEEWPEAMEEFVPEVEYSESSFRARMENQTRRGLTNQRYLASDAREQTRSDRSDERSRIDSGSIGPWS